LYFEPEIVEYCQVRLPNDGAEQFLKLKPSDIEAMIFFGIDKLPATTIKFYLYG
jgi:hypothetical protein